MNLLPFKQDSTKEFSESKLTDFENKFKIKVPETLASFLKIQNGGELENIWFLDKYYINHFFPLANNQYGTIHHAMEFLLSEGIEKMIPFAGDDDSMTYCISASENSYGKIFRYQSCDWAPGENPLIEICGSFGNLISSFKEDN